MPLTGFDPQSQQVSARRLTPLKARALQSASADVAAVGYQELLCQVIQVTHSKGKAVPLQAWSGPEGYRKLRFPDFMTTAQEGGKFVSLTHRPLLPPGNSPGTHFC